MPSCLIEEGGARVAGKGRPDKSKSPLAYTTSFQPVVHVRVYIFILYIVIYIYICIRDT